ncbi:MAG: hypothetical protein SCARUB_02999 [Candidatus Scalindua rubra]|uniref:Uncharacterized protein n=1 Tax=Candidatus Scalindua rubra TaxID=1872076 RepID=A0A1E3X8D3_9BACT|nr:MAG: hypothetical protein SCARUB_02999 [Candidatus Scalindua rubra]
MKPWIKRPKEEAYLLNPPFCCLLVTASTIGYTSVENQGLPFSLPFLILPIVLHKQTRETLPRKITTSLAAWLEENQHAKILYYERVKSLLPYVREAMLFGGLHNWLDLKNGDRISTSKTDRDIGNFVNKATDEVKECVKHTHFVGRWFANAGSVETVMALWGVRP